MIHLMTSLIGVRLTLSWYNGYNGSAGEGSGWLYPLHHSCRFRSGTSHFDFGHIPIASLLVAGVFSSYIGYYVGVCIRLFSLKLSVWFTLLIGFGSVWIISRIWSLHQHFCCLLKKLGVFKNLAAFNLRPVAYFKMLVDDLMSRYILRRLD